MPFKSKKHKLTFERNMTKGFLTGLRTRCDQLAGCRSLYDIEKEILKRIKRNADYLLNHWEKFPPKERENEET